jgi:hypothetical protein
MPLAPLCSIDERIVMIRGDFRQKKKSTKSGLRALVQLGKFSVFGFQFSVTSFLDLEQGFWISR